MRAWPFPAFWSVTETDGPSDGSDGSGDPGQPIDEGLIDRILSLMGVDLHDPLLSTGIAVTVTVILAVVLYRLLRRVLAAAAKRNRGVAEFEPMLVRLLRWLYLPIAVLFVLQQAGVDLGSLWTLISAGIAMVAIGFVAVWSLLSNVSSTFMIFSTRMFKVGDEVELLEPTASEGLKGTIFDINVLFTTIEQKSEDGAISTTRIPNNVFFQKALRVYGRNSAPPPSDLLKVPEEKPAAEAKQEA